MTSRLFLSAVALAFGPAIALAQALLSVDPNEVYFQFTPSPSFAPSGTKAFLNPASARLCGFAILANHHNKSNPKVEWDVNIDEIVIGDRQVAGISAGTFDVVGRVRKARPPIIDLSFSIEGETGAIPAKIVGSPNFDNAIRAMLEAQPASKLFTAFSEAQLVIMTLKYDNGTADTLKIRGYGDRRKFGGGKNSYFNQCLRGFAPRAGRQVPVP